ncbi:MAG TPA: anaerobic ribonucleoside-triphosphate reductase activating protein [Spirochaetia bacterium]
MVIAGFQKISLSDYPGKISAILFTQGCNFRCRYCHNPELVDQSRYAAPLAVDALFGFLEERVGRLGGVVVTGGEPTLHADLPALLGRIKSLGLSVKLDTNGSRPDALEDVIGQGLVDYIAMDVKAPLAVYEKVTRVPVDPAAIARSIGIVLHAGLPHELRTTYLPSLLSAEDVRSIGGMVRGCRAFFLQAFRPTKTLDPSVLTEAAPDKASLDSLCAMLVATGIPAQVR